MKLRRWEKGKSGRLRTAGAPGGFRPFPNWMLFLALVAAWTGAGRVARAQTIRDDFYVTNGTVNTAVLSGNTLYIGGYFTQVGPATGHGVPIDATTGLAVSGFPKVNGVVLAAVSDGAGGWFIGGAFESVGGIPRRDIAHILANNTVSNWDPNAIGGVNALLLDGSTLYVGGSFSSIGGQSRRGLAALDASTGLATAWDPQAFGGAVLALALNGSIIYAGGNFDEIGGQFRDDLAALDVTTGLATAWDPQAGGEVDALAISGSTVYAGGFFASIGGQNRNHIAALDATTGLATAWDPDASFGFNNSYVLALAVDGSTVYAGGTFDQIGGASRTNLAGLDVTTGNATVWYPQPNNEVQSLVVLGSTVYAGGYFTTIGGQPRNRIAAVDKVNGFATSWNPNVNGFSVRALAADGSTVYAGGDFTSIGGQTRNNIAALDVTTGVVTDWNPDANTRVKTLLAYGNTIYAGGDFSSIGGQVRHFIAALDAPSGAAKSWNPNASGGVSALALKLGPMRDDVTVYAGGDFTSIGGQSRSRIAALDASLGSAGLATGWNPVANSTVSALVVDGTTVYVGGSFTTLGSLTRNHIGAIGTGSSLATPWNPNADDAVHALAVSGPTVYAGGMFLNVGGQSRKRIAALDATSGLATGWNPSVNSGYDISAFLLSGSTVYVGGSFSNIGGQSRGGLAALDSLTGLASDWSAYTNSQVMTLAGSGSDLYAGGSFASIGNEPQSYLAAFGEEILDVPPIAHVTDVALLQPCQPNPFRASTRLRFALAGPETVSLSVYDVAGREVATLLTRERMGPGTHQVEFRGTGLPSGVYLCRLQAGGRAQTARIVHIE
jgi:Domain of unknown function (DUF5122) beta-propeller